MTQTKIADGSIALTTANGPVGTFTLPNATSAAVSNTSVTVGSLIYLQPTNVSAASLVGSTNTPYISALSSGASFTVKGASTVAFVGTETFNYLMFN